MWEYNYLYPDDELMHYGVPGMKWGRRKVRSTLSNYKASKKQYGKDFKAAAKAARKTKSFAVTKRGKAKKANLDEAYSQKFDQMQKSSAKLRAEKYKLNSANRSAVKKYSKSYDKASSMEAAANTKWREVKEKRKALGRTAVSRTLNAAKGKSDAAKAYTKAYNEASAMSDAANTKWRETKELRKKTGRNAVSRTVNNIKYRR